MTAEQEKIIADILGLTAENIKALPEDIKAEMDFTADNSAPEIEEERLEIYRSLESCWRRAVTRQTIAEISEKYETDKAVIESLETDVQNEIADLYLSGADDEEVYGAIISADKAQAEKEFQRIMSNG